MNANSKIKLLHLKRLVVFLTSEKNLELTSFPIRTSLDYGKGGLSLNDVISCRCAMTLSFFGHLPELGRLEVS